MHISLKKIFIFLAAILFSAAAFALTPNFYKSPGDGSNLITIAADSWCPINCAPPEARLGVGIDLAKAIFEPLGYTVNYKLIPWTDALERVRSGQVDAVVGASRLDDASLIFPRQPVYRITDDFYVLRGNSWRFQGVHTLKGKKLGIIADYGYSNDVSRYIRENSDRLNAVQIASGTHALQANIKKLMNLQVDVIVEARPVMEYTLATMNLGDKIEWAGSIPQAEVYVAFSPASTKSQRLAEIFDRGMNQLAAAGKLEEYYRAYGLSTSGRR